MLPFIFGAALAGWLAGESFRRRRALGQRPSMPVPPPIETWMLGPDVDLVHALREAEQQLARYRAMVQEAERRFDALELSNAPDETLREAGADVQDLRANVANTEQKIEQLERAIESLERYRTPSEEKQPEPTPPSVPIGMRPGTVARLPANGVPFQSPAAGPGPAMVTAAALPTGGAAMAVPSVSMIQETAAPMRPSVPSGGRSGISVPLTAAPAGGGMVAFPGT